MVGVSPTAASQPGSADTSTADASTPEATGAAPDGSAAGAEPPVRAGRRSLAAALLLGAAGAGVVLIAAGKTWATGFAASAGGLLPVSASGKDVTALPGGLAVTGLAAMVAVFAVRGAARPAVSAVLALAGAGTAAAAFSGASDTAALRQAAAKASGLTGTALQHVGHTGWPWATAAGGVLLLLAGLIAVVHSSAWPAMSSRYERDGAPAARRGRPAPDPTRPEEMWKALDRGEDPTADPAAG